MTYLVAADLPAAPAGERFRALLARPGILQMPGAHNGMAALQARAAGFEALYLSGAAMTASMGVPDLGMITVDEVCFFIRQITRAAGLPLLVDGDTGYGEALNVMHMVRSFEDAGAAAVHIEDQLLPKKCGHLNDKKLADPHDMAIKIAAARRARRNLFIVARTDAAASEGIDGAVARAKLYLEAGADAIFPEALTTAEMFRDVCLACRCAAACQHDRIRPHAVLHRGRIRGDGLSDGDLAGEFAARRQQGAGSLVCGDPPRRRDAVDAGADADAGGTLRGDRLPRLRGAGREHREDRDPRGDAAASVRSRHMNRRHLLLLLTLAPLSARAQGPNPTGPQPELPKERLVITTRDGVHHEFSVEMATTQEQQTVGLMFRPSVPADGGMLFDWRYPRDSQMWMRNTIAPLDMVFINADGTIRSIAENTVPQSLAVIDSRGPVRATLELGAGTTARLNIRVGDKVQQRIFGNAP